MGFRNKQTSGENFLPEVITKENVHN